MITWIPTDSIKPQPKKPRVDNSFYYLEKKKKKMKEEKIDYNSFLEEAEDILIGRVNVMLSDLDYNWKKAWNLGYSPMRAAIEALFEINVRDLLREPRQSKSQG